MYYKCSVSEELAVNLHSPAYLEGTLCADELLLLQQPLHLLSPPWQHKTIDVEVVAVAVAVVVVVLVVILYVVAKVHSA